MKRMTILLLCLTFLIVSAGCDKISQDHAHSTGYEELSVTLANLTLDIFADDFEKKLEEGKFTSPTGELQDKWNAMLRDAKRNFSGNIDKNAFGYKLIDITSDGNPELFFARSDDTVLAVFTIYKGKLTLLDAYSMTYRCAVRDTNELYSLNADENGGYQYEITAFNNNTGKNDVVVKFGSEVIVGENAATEICQEMVNGIIYTSSTQRIEELKTLYPHIHGNIYLGAEFNLF